jgi:broad specificity phosphatase PhoE
MHLYAIRHGQSYLNLPDWDGEDGDAPLSPLGEKQAETLAAWLPDHLPTVDAIYSSTLRRARGTAIPLGAAYKLEVIFDHRLREIGNNRIDHSPYPEGKTPTRSEWGAFWFTERPFSPVAVNDNNETWMHMRIRVATFIEEMIQQRPGQTVIAVCHGGTIDAIFDYCFGVGPWRRCEINTDNTGITHFEYVAIPGREAWRLYHHNRIDHLRVLEDVSG